MPEIDLILRLGSFCQAAYDLYAKGTALLPVGYTKKQVFYLSSKPFAILCSDKEKKSPDILAFRGTEEKSEWVLDGFCKNIEWQGMIVHGGFLATYLQMRSSITLALDGPCFITGHSLGAAVATLALLDTEINADLGIVFASPRVVTDAALADDLVRVQNAFDVVCQLPPDVLGFVHVGDAINLSFNLGSFEENHRLENYLKHLNKEN